MIRLRRKKRIALAISVTVFTAVGFSSGLSSAKETASPLVPMDANIANVANAPVSDSVEPDFKESNPIVRKVSFSPDHEKLRELQSGTASYYGPGFHGRRTANGEKFNMNAMTAAHRTLPFGTKLKVTNLANGQSAIVRVNDRGPYVGSRIIDLSVAAAKKIGSIHSGTAKVKLEVVEN